MPGGFAVVLMLEPGATEPASASWFEDYFLSTTSGVGAYWWKQSNRALRLTGDVFGWYTFPNNTDYTDRNKIYSKVLEVADPKVVAAKGTTIELGYDRCIIFIALSGAGVGGTHAGSAPPPPLSNPLRVLRLRGFMVVDTNSQFNYIAHEMGHQLNLSHTFDESGIKYEPWAQPGEYGHPYCIMSAQRYGRTSPQWTPPGIPATAPAAQREIGPCLNGWDASVSGLPSWIPNQVSWRPGVDADLTIELESLGSWPGALTKVVRVQSAGSEFAIEYRNNQDYWDGGLPSSVVVINHGTGGRGRVAGGSATFVGEIPLPMALGRPGPRVYNNSGHGFAIEVLDWKQSSVVLRIFKGTATAIGVWPTVTIETGEVKRVPMGTFDYTNAGVRCVTGVWEVIRLLRLQIATIEWQVPPWLQTFPTRWWVNGQELTEPAGMINVTADTDSPFPLPNGTRYPKTVELWFAINGPNQLKLSNLRPELGNFSVDVRCLASFTVATLDRTEAVNFEGELLEHDPKDEFDEAFYTCLTIEKNRLPWEPHHEVEIPEPFQPQQPDEPRHFSRNDTLDDPPDKPKHISRKDLRDHPPEEPRRLSRNDLLNVLERLPENPLNASVHRQLFRKITGVAPERVRVVEASAASTGLPKEVTPCSSGPAQDLRSSETAERRA